MTEPITDKLGELLVSRMKPIADGILASWHDQPKTNLAPIAELGIHHQGIEEIEGDQVIAKQAWADRKEN